MNLIHCFSNVSSVMAGPVNKYPNDTNDSTTFIQNIKIINYTGACSVVITPSTRGNSVAPIIVPKKNTLIALPARFTYLLVSAMIVGKVADMPSPKKQTPTHITVSLELKINSTHAEIVAKVNSIAH